MDHELNRVFKVFLSIWKLHMLGGPRRGIRLDTFEAPVKYPHEDGLRRRNKRVRWVFRLVSYAVGFTGIS